jgi:hypothetical protein
MLVKKDSEEVMFRKVSMAKHVRRGFKKHLSMQLNGKLYVVWV